MKTPQSFIAFYAFIAGEPLRNVRREGKLNINRNYKKFTFRDGSILCVGAPVKPLTFDDNGPVFGDLLFQAVNAYPSKWDGDYATIRRFNIL